MLTILVPVGLFVAATVVVDRQPKPACIVKALLFSIEALSRLYQGVIKAVLRSYYGCITALFRRYYTYMRIYIRVCVYVCV